MAKTSVSRAISTDVYEAIGQPSLQKPTKRLCGPDKSPLKVLGCATVQLTHKQTTIKLCLRYPTP